MSKVYGHVTNVRAVDSRSVSQIIVEVDLAAHVAVTQMLFGKDVLLELAPKVYGAYGVIAHAQAIEPPRPKTGGELCKWAGILCADPDFQTWLQDRFRADWPQAADREEAAAAMVREACNVSSRRELDQTPEAGRIFREQFMRPFNDFMQGKPLGNPA